MIQGYSVLVVDDQRPQAADVAAVAGLALALAKDTGSPKGMRDLRHGSHMALLGMIYRTPITGLLGFF